MTEIAKRLGIGRSTLYRKMREIGLEARLTSSSAKHLAGKSHSREKLSWGELMLRRVVAKRNVPR